MFNGLADSWFGQQTFFFIQMVCTFTCKFKEIAISLVIKVRSHLIYLGFQTDGLIFQKPLTHTRLFNKLGNQGPIHWISPNRSQFSMSFSVVLGVSQYLDPMHLFFFFINDLPSYIDSICSQVIC